MVDRWWCYSYVRVQMDLINGISGTVFTQTFVYLVSSLKESLIADRWVAQSKSLHTTLSFRFENSWSSQIGEYQWFQQKQKAGLVSKIPLSFINLKALMTWQGFFSMLITLNWFPRQSGLINLMLSIIISASIDGWLPWWTNPCFRMLMG